MPETFSSTRFFREGAAFVVVGAINTVVGYGVFLGALTWWVSHLPRGYLIALTVSYAIAIPMAYVLHSRFVFRVPELTWLGFGRFVMVNVAAVGLNFVGLPVAVELLGFAPAPAQLGVLAVVIAFSYLGHKFFSFRTRHP